jgi:hypothetical protein
MVAHGDSVVCSSGKFRAMIGVHKSCCSTWNMAWRHVWIWSLIRLILCLNRQIMSSLSRYGAAARIASLFWRCWLPQKQVEGLIYWFCRPTLRTFFKPSSIRGLVHEYKSIESWADSDVSHAAQRLPSKGWLEKTFEWNLRSKLTFLLRTS